MNMVKNKPKGFGQIYQFGVAAAKASIFCAKYRDQTTHDVWLHDHSDDLYAMGIVVLFLLPRRFNTDLFEKKERSLSLGARRHLYTDTFECGDNSHWAQVISSP